MLVLFPVGFLFAESSSEFDSILHSSSENLHCDDEFKRQSLLGPTIDSNNSSLKLLDYQYSKNVFLESKTTEITAPPVKWQLLANDIIHELVGDDVSRTLGGYPDLRIVNEKIPNAFAHKHNHLLISIGLIDQISSSDEFAFVIAHELGHLFLKHSKLPAPNTMAEFIQREKEADQYALKLLATHNFDRKKGALLLSRLSNLGDKNGTPLKTIYPSLNERILALN